MKVNWERKWKHRLQPDTITWCRVRVGRSPMQRPHKKSPRTKTSNTLYLTSTTWTATNIPPANSQEETCQPRMICASKWMWSKSTPLAPKTSARGCIATRLRWRKVTTRNSRPSLISTKSPSMTTKWKASSTYRSITTTRTKRCSASTTIKMKSRCISRTTSRANRNSMGCAMKWLAPLSPQPMCATSILSNTTKTFILAAPTKTTKPRLIKRDTSVRNSDQLIELWKTFINDQ